MEEQNPIGITSAGFEEKDGKYTAFENVQKHVYFVNEMSIERTKRKFIERFLRRLPIEEVEKLVGFKMEDVELEGQYTEGSKFSVELPKSCNHSFVYVSEEPDKDISLAFTECSKCKYRP